MTDSRAQAGPRTRALTWQVTETGGFETAWITPTGPRSFSARGRVFAALPHPYWLSYALETGPDWVTRSMTVTAEPTDGDVGGAAHLELRRDGESGIWTANGTALDWAGPETLDCDLGLSPLTNTMPVLRHGLHSAAGTHAFTMVWISVPDLTLHMSPQTYGHLGPGPAGTRVHFASGDFESDVEFDEAGFVTSYAGLAHRVHPLS
ncbi:putative glycolipid-binding domain-containing protein [Streptomyces sp. TRM66268-LWL]|uniref:Glycolipid-binding domain-containing protein n=1 Tax=Streptomyces polyasparticus TaxID=2767826 RepID=A0ABR7SGQ1_9ACTN|nr:putative glycolipid-binding domain-containing protein [Streptomyces polyasparticus]MBC9714039.1 putative glycolipid-binding domain-containing protein [Streptomyces polyasparticus]